MKTIHRRSAQAKRKYQADPSSIYRLMSRIQPFTEQEQAALALPVREALDGFLKGHAGQSDFDTLAAAANVCLVRSEAVSPLCVEASQRGQDALMRAKRRFDSLGRWGLDGPGIQEVGDLVDLYEQFLALSTPQQMRDALRTVLERSSAGEVLQ
jgi:hypothetical protein